jgi:hypothetical protein
MDFVEPMELDGDFMDEVYPRTIRNQRASRAIQARFRGARMRGFGSYDSVLGRQRQAIRYGYGGPEDYDYNTAPRNSYTRNTPHYRRMERDHAMRYYGIPYWEYEAGNIGW